VAKAKKKKKTSLLKAKRLSKKKRMTKAKIRK